MSSLNLASLVASKNIGVAEIGFVSPSGARFVCLARSCGFTASAHKLENLGWQRVEN